MKKKFALVLSLLFISSMFALGSVSGCGGDDGQSCTPGEKGGGDPCSSDSDCASCSCMKGDGYSYCLGVDG